MPISGYMTFGIAKQATAYAVRSAARNELYKKEGLKFIILMKGGGSVRDLPSAQEAAKVSVEFVERREQREWDYVFVKGK